MTSSRRRSRIARGRPSVYMATQPRTAAEPSPRRQDRREATTYPALAPVGLGCPMVVAAAARASARAVSPTDVIR